MELSALLFHIRENVSAYNKHYVRNILDYNDQYITVNSKSIETDCWITARMLISVFNQGTNKLLVDVYHIELGGYHDFLVMHLPNGTKYLVGSWADKFTMDIKEIPDIDDFNDYLLALKGIDILTRKEMLRSLFGDLSIKDSDQLDVDIHIVVVGMTLYYDDISVLSYPSTSIINKNNIRNISILGSSNV